jgi:two-component SAPR family response regulator
MPQMRGPELAERVREFLPETRVVFMSGYPQHSEANPDLGAEKFFVQKPFTRESLVLTVGQAMTSQTGRARRKVRPLANQSELCPDSAEGRCRSQERY